MQERYAQILFTESIRSNKLISSNISTSCNELSNEHSFIRRRIELVSLPCCNLGYVDLSERWTFVEIGVTQRSKYLCVTWSTSTDSEQVGDISRQKYVVCDVRAASSSVPQNHFPFVSIPSVALVDGGCGCFHQFISLSGREIRTTLVPR